MNDLRNKFISLSNVLLEVPSSKTLSLYLLAVSFLGGFITRFLHQGNLVEALVYGGAEGFWWLFLPAVLAAALSTSFFSRKLFKYFLLSGLLSTIVVAFLYSIGVAAFNPLSLREPFVFFANALVYVIWFVATYLVLSSHVHKALLVGLIHPFFNLSFLFLWNSLGWVETAYLVQPNVVTVLKFIVSSSIMLLALGALFYVINAPAKRNFGVSTVQAITLFFGQWLFGKKELEDFLSEFGEEVRTLFGVVAFRRKKNKTLKALFFVPHLHYGPFGNLGGSAYPALIEQTFSKKYNTSCFTFHPLVTHDVNPLHSTQFSRLEKIFDNMIRRLKSFHSRGFMTQTAYRENQANVFGFGPYAFFSITRAPYSTEDFDLSAGWILRSLALKNYSDALIVDRHNSITDGEMFDVGSEVFEEFEHAISSLTPHSSQRLYLGVAEDPLHNGSLNEGIGQAGLKVAVLGFGKKKACVVLVDANNAYPSFRKAVLDRLRRYSFSWVDLFTTDTHSVNTIGGIHNPLGAHSHRWLLDSIENAVGRAVKEMEPVEATMVTKRASFSVLGIKRQAELVSTVNSIVSIAKILAPIILILSFFMIFLAFLWVK